MPAQTQSPIFARSHDLLVWLLQHTAKFPKSERFRMAKRVEDSAFAFYDLIARATKLRDKRRKAVYARRRLKTKRDRVLAGALSPQLYRASIQAWIAHVRHGDTWGLRRSVLRRLVIGGSWGGNYPTRPMA
ncbi:MAG TPA: hypothetical protein VJG32_17655 [Anaerolineae bacterium]|nr:hypothetical protein [Anaerolineae bacterium]